MPELVTASANLRVTNDERRSVFSVATVSPTVTAATLANFVDAVETLYNNGQCAARLNVTMDLVR